MRSVKSVLPFLTLLVVLLQGFDIVVIQPLDTRGVPKKTVHLLFEKSHTALPTDESGGSFNGCVLGHVRPGSAPAAVSENP